MGGYQINTTTAHSVFPFFLFNKKAILSLHRMIVKQNDSKRGLSTWIINK